MTPLVLLGGGGHAAVVAESARRAGFRLVAIASAAPFEAGGPFEDPRIERLNDPVDPVAAARIEALVREGSRLHAAVGDATLRRSWRLCFGRLHPRPSPRSSIRPRSSPPRPRSLPARMSG